MTVESKVGMKAAEMEYYSTCKLVLMSVDMMAA